MIAMGIREPGPPEVLVPVERPTPALAAGEVLVKVAAAGVNRPDVMQRQGNYPPPPGASDIPGLEIAGEVLAVADDVKAWRTGDRVCALVSGGGYAEVCSAPAPQCLPDSCRPRSHPRRGNPRNLLHRLDQCLRARRLVEGESILIHGGSSGIGTTAIQLAHAFGARVFTTAGSDEKCAACEALGAELAINYRTTDFVTAVADATRGRGVNVVLDMVGGDYLQRNIDCLGMDGRLVQIGLLGGAKGQINMLPILQRRLWITGRPCALDRSAEKAAIARAVQRASGLCWRPAPSASSSTRRFPCGRRQRLTA